jgi:hypothetical protein
MRRLVTFLLALAISAIPPALWAASTSKNLSVTVTAPVVQTITAVSLSNNSFAGGAASGTTVGAIAVTMSPPSPPFSGSLSLTGTNASSFQIVGPNLETNGVDAAGSYSVNIVATQAGATGSPLAQPETITGTTASPAEVPGPSAALYSANPYYACQANRYAAANGSAGNNGLTSNTPWDLTTAANYAAPAGTCINLAAGTYTIPAGNSPLSIAHGGSAPSSGAAFPATTYVVWRCTTMPFSFSSGVLQGEGAGCRFLQGGSQGGSLVGINGGVSYVMFDGFEFNGNSDATDSNCLDNESSGGTSHHIWVFNSDIHGCGQSGIQWNGTDWLYVIHNVWHDNSQTNGVDGSGASFYEPVLTPGYGSPTTQDTAFNSTTAGAVFHIVVNYNVGFHNFNNFSGCTDGEGIIFDDWGFQQNAGTPYAGHGLAMGNVMYFNGGGGVEVFSGAASTGQIWLVNNSAYNNYWSTCNSGTFRADFYHNAVFKVHTINNLAYTVGGGGILANNVPFMGHCGGCGSNVWGTNIAFPSGSAGTFDAPNTFPTAGTNHNTDNTDPKFTSVTPSSMSNNFALQGTSPAIGFGQAFDLWQQSGPVDAGACVFSAPGPVAHCP